MATQYLIGESGASLPDGIVLAHTLHGEPDATVTHAYTAAPGGLKLVPVGETGVAYSGDRVQLAEDRAAPDPAVVTSMVTVPDERDPTRAKRCHAKDDTCMGWAIKDSFYCAAHAGVWQRRPKTEDT